MLPVDRRDGAHPAERARVRARSAAPHPPLRHARSRPVPVARARSRSSSPGCSAPCMGVAWLADRLGGHRLAHRRTPTPSSPGVGRTSATRSSCRSPRGSRAAEFWQGYLPFPAPRGVRHPRRCWSSGSPLFLFSPWVKRLGVDLRFWIAQLRALPARGVLPAVEHVPAARAAVPGARGARAAAVTGVPGRPRRRSDRGPVAGGSTSLVRRRVRLDAPVIQHPMSARDFRSAQMYGIMDEHVSTASMKGDPHGSHEAEDR